MSPALKNVGFGAGNVLKISSINKIDIDEIMKKDLIIIGIEENLKKNKLVLFLIS